MDEQIDVAVLATMSPKEAMKVLERLRSNISRNQEEDLKKLIRDIATEVNTRIEELKESYTSRNIDFIINGTVTIDIKDGKIGVSYVDSKQLTTKVSKNAIHHYRNNISELVGKPMYFNLNGIQFEVSLSANNVWVVIHDDKVISADSPSTLIKRVAKEILGKQSNQSGWLVIKVQKEDEEYDDKTEETIVEDIHDEFPQDFASEIE